MIQIHLSSFNIDVLFQCFDVIFKHFNCVTEPIIYPGTFSGGLWGEFVILAVKAMYENSKYLMHLNSQFNDSSTSVTETLEDLK